MRLSVAVLVFVAARAAAADDFRFKTPDGWVGAFAHESPVDMDEVRAGVAEQARRFDFYYFAANPDDMVDSPPPTMAVMLKDRVYAFDETVLERWAENAPNSFDVPSAAKVREKALVEINGVTAGRLVIEYTSDGREMTQLLFRIPGRTQQAVLGFDAPRAKFNRYRPIFEDAARATRGFSPPPSPYRMVWIGVAALIVGAAVIFRRKRT